MRTALWITGRWRRRSLRIGALLLFWPGISAGHPSWAQTPMPPPASEQAATAPLPDPFFDALEALSRRYGVAFVAEGRPFPQVQSDSAPPLTTDVIPQANVEVNSHPKVISPEEREVQKVAARFDYTAVHQGQVYLLIKRYTNPDDTPDVTPDECRNGLKLAAKAFPGGFFTSNFADTPEKALVKILNRESFATPTTEQWIRIATRGVSLSELDRFVQHTVWMLAYKYYFQTYQDRIAGILFDMEERPPRNPSFHWKTLDKSRVFGYDTLRVDFIPISDADRVVVPAYNAPLPRPGFLVRDDVTVPTPDPTDPSGLSEQARRFLDDAGRSSHVVSLAQAITALNRQAALPNAFGVDAMYAAKHVMLVGVETLPASVVMQSLADVYGLRVERQERKVVLTAPRPFHPTAFPEVKRALLSVIPAPIYRAFRIHNTPAPRIEAPAGSPAVSGTSLSLDAYDARGVAIQHSLVQMFRSLAEPQVKPRPGSSLFELARMARAYVGLCGIADCPMPPYLISELTDFANHVTLRGGFEGDARTGMEVTLSLTYIDPQTGANYGPIEFFHSSMPRTAQARP
ncbi:MAG: hypothetical protein JWN14_1657 [Chthonomonadales bacterium]|nr:hypothetical protein [Chthonomonadales bacterium]